MGEEACEFEHRDLHWGNLLIRRTDAPAATSAVAARLRGVELEAATEGVTVTVRWGGGGWAGAPQASASQACGPRGLIPQLPATHPYPHHAQLIDFTLSRLVTVTGEVAFCDLAADPELFKGPKGSVQVSCAPA